MFSGLFGKRRYKLNGRIIIHSLPPSQGYMVSLKLFPVAGPACPPPFGGEPPGEAFEGSVDLAKNIHIRQNLERPRLVIPFKLKPYAGYYYLGVTVFLFRDGLNGLMAQMERVCFGRPLLDLSSNHLDAGDFPIRWPDTSLEDLYQYAIFRPGKPPEFFDSVPYKGG